MALSFLKANNRHILNAVAKRQSHPEGEVNLAKRICFFAFVFIRVHLRPSLLKTFCEQGWTQMDLARQAATKYLNLSIHRRAADWTGQSGGEGNTVIPWM